MSSAVPPTDPSSSSSPPSAPPPLFLYDHPVSSYAQKVRICLRWKKLPFVAETPRDLGSGRADPDFAAANPRMEVPALIVRRGEEGQEFGVWGSGAICEFLEEEEEFGGEGGRRRRSLWEGCAGARGRAEGRMVDEVCGSCYEGLNWGVGEVKWFGRGGGEGEGTVGERILTAAREQTVQLQEWLEERLGEKKFFNGDVAPGYADFSAITVVHRSVFYGFPLKKGGRLEGWYERMLGVEEVRVTLEEMREAASALAGVDGRTLWKPHGGRRREYRDHRLEFLVKNGGVGIVLDGLRDDNVRFGWPHPKKA